ncbi:neocarzinostatin apoprotein domain-containing protein [Myceligenerans pegani]|uniref:Neocarzinostatin family protein n=1 Tax=Myceligenerans pegani TaxID=2776917 RepID=A0ABR9N5R4_9MICO|nr:neocarzinostatin apoprotein domain-containing protein [Myceligenerans sp. TRM 65318]MBE1878438.1 hypothetical protein [Myceligenerans sp. TRM 65318]MBE3020709.1 hypothetical protein [Myceligenerans sp. TRM 65318]
MRRLLLGAVVLALAACTTAFPPEPQRSAESALSSHGGPSLTVEGAGGAWIVHGTGYDEGGGQYLVQCTGGTSAGASALDRCDMSTMEQVMADDDGRIETTRPVKGFVHVGAVAEVDCAGEPCTLAVADLTDRVVAAAQARLPAGASIPEAPALELSELDLDTADGSVTVNGTGYEPGAEVRIVQCPTDARGVVAAECLYDDGVRLIADGDGSVTATLRVRREMPRAGAAVDCAQAGACVLANAWTDGGRMALVDLLWE